MGNFNSAIREGIYRIECPLLKIADAAKVNKSTIYTAMHGDTRLRAGPARMIANAVCSEIHSDIERRKREIEELTELDLRIRRSFNEEYGGM